MKVQMKKLEGFAVGLSMAGVALFSSAAPQAAQRMCTGACQGCFTCGVTAVPLLAWLAWQAKSGGRLRASLRRAGMAVFVLLKRSG
jgi:hypothetical protein